MISALPTPDAIAEVELFCENVRQLVANPKLNSRAGYFEGMEVETDRGSLLSAMVPGAQALLNPMTGDPAAYELLGQHWYLLWDDEQILGFWFVIRNDKRERHIPMRAWLSQNDDDADSYELYIYDSDYERMELGVPHPLWSEFPLEELFKTYNQVLGHALDYCSHGDDDKAKQSIERWKFARNQRAVDMLEEDSR